MIGLIHTLAVSNLTKRACSDQVVQQLYKSVTLIKIDTTSAHTCTIHTKIYSLLTIFME